MYMAFDIGTFILLASKSPENFNKRKTMFCYCFKNEIIIIVVYMCVCELLGVNIIIREQPVDNLSYHVNSRD